MEVYLSQPVTLLATRQAQCRIHCLQVAAHVPESSPHTQLQEYERRTDACLLQKRSEVQDALRCLHRVAKLLRLCVCSSHANQVASARSSGSLTNIFAK